MERSLPDESRSRSQRTTGAQIWLEALRRESVDVVFGYPGGAVIGMYDTLYSSPVVRHILTRHEQGAAHAADGFARATGKTGVCLVTSGPGATNLVTGLANAFLDSSPLVAFTGQVATAAIGRDSFQEADIVGITMPVTKHNYLLKSIEDIPRIVKEAFHIASTGRPGPVLVDLPKDVMAAEINESDVVWPETANLPGYKPTSRPNPRQVGLARNAIARARRPLLYVGGGCVQGGAQQALQQLAEGSGIPVVSSLMGLGAFPSAHSLFAGMVGMHGTVAANYAVAEADVLIAVGARFDDRVTGDVSRFAPNAKIIHIDVDPAEIGKNVRVDIPIVSDARLALEALADGVTLGVIGSPERTGEWRQLIASWKEENQPDRGSALDAGIAADGAAGPGPKPQWVISKVGEAVEAESIVVTDVGQHQMWSAQLISTAAPRHFISSGGLGTMGFGLPAAIGAAVGKPDALVIAIVGDGGFQMNIQELATAVAYQLNVKVVLINNRRLGMVRQWQELFYGGRYSQTVFERSPDFVKIAEAYGARGLVARTPAEVEKVLQEGLSTPGPVVMEMVVEPEENVFPFVPPGKSVQEMLMAKGGEGVS